MVVPSVLVAEHVLWCSLGLNVDQASVTQQKFRHCYPVPATGKREAIGFATRCVGLRKRSQCKDRKVQTIPAWGCLLNWD